VITSIGQGALDVAFLLNEKTVWDHAPSREAIINERETVSWAAKVLRDAAEKIEALYGQLLDNEST